MQINITKHKEAAFGYAKQLSDPRMVGLLLFLFVVLMIGWSGVKAIETNYGLQKQISKLEQQIAVQKLTNDNLKLQTDYYNTPQYLELAARKDFGLAGSGETVLVVPRSVALANTVDLPRDKQKAAEAQKKEPAYKRNMQAWMDFLFHRSND
ncbi:MAG TPA: septum formation initiator family protein [Patescibacteria group bacterium]|nr:septum formation initiator family protein [Patescibacteria group bacterium]